MKLSQLLEEIRMIKTVGPMDVEITGLANDSRQVKPGYIFVAVPGKEVDGYQYIEEAIWRGAVAIVAQKEYFNNRKISLIIVESAHDTLCRLAARFYGYPASRLKLVGITGTNGKTTSSYLIRSIFEKAGFKTGLLGTIDYILGEGRQIPARLTTPDVLDINRFLAQMVDSGCTAGVMEVSSHALHQGRINGIPFQAAVFTNLGRDHLDYHNTGNEYLETKAKLFRALSSKGWAVVNLDDPYHRIILQNTQVKVVGYGLKNVSCSDIRFKIKARAIKHEENGIRFSIYAPAFGSGFRLETSLIGLHNVYNAMAAVCVGLCQGIPVDAIQEGIRSVKNIPGRLERIELGQPYKIYVDYAHTPDALETVLSTVRQITAGRIILVFGCGGNRDKQKRPLMGRIASQQADCVLITTDNPRHEDPLEITNEIQRGFIGDNYKVILNRKEAILEGLRMARPKEGDSIIIAGKGHENYQILKHTIVPFSDKAVIEEFLVKDAVDI